MQRKDQQTQKLQLFQKHYELKFNPKWILFPTLRIVSFRGNIYKKQA